MIALVGAAVWTAKDKGRAEYHSLYYWLRVMLRYRLALGVIGYGFIKVYPMQSPFPSLSNLNTNYGDLTSWKIFSMTLGIVPGYESFLGWVEILAGLLLLYRQTATIGAFLVIVYTGNVFLANLAYEGGEYVYAFYLIAIALFLLAYDAIRLYTLFGLEKPTLPTIFKPHFQGNQKSIRLALKSAFVVIFLLVYGFATQKGFETDAYQYPKTAGLPDASGIYEVAEFRLNDSIIPYSAVDSLRWKDVVFEEWATLSVRSNRPVILEPANVETIRVADSERRYEVTGSAGRHYYSYRIDAARNVLLLQNKNSNYPDDKIELNFTRPNDRQIILSGRNNQEDSIYVVLNKKDKKYLFKEVAKQGRGKALEL
ncbi:DoxX family protein [Arcticibacter sp.]|uniref:DoxX family protein n=1 Tax=Arcticibacter sp. TaxID=1872630 RepID=UPI003890C5F4